MRNNVTTLSFRLCSLYHFVKMSRLTYGKQVNRFYCAVSSITDGFNFSILVKHFDFAKSYNAIDLNRSLIRVDVSYCKRGAKSGKLLVDKWKLKLLL